MRLIYFIIIISLSLHSQNEIKSIDFDEYKPGKTDNTENQFEGFKPCAER